MSKKDNIKIKKTEKQNSVKVSETDKNKSNDTNDENRTVELLISFIIVFVIAISLMPKFANGIQSACD